MKIFCLLSISFALFGQKPPALPPDSTPQEVRDLIRTLAEAVQNKDAQAFLDHVDGATPDREMLHYYLEGLAARDNVISTIEIVSDKGDLQMRALALDWTLNIDSEPLRRALINVTIEKQGKNAKKQKWTLTSIAPIDFFKPPAH